jgi:hypothetical protein
MIEITILHADQATLYVPAPCRGIVVGAKVVFQTNTVEPNDTVVIGRAGTAVCTVTAVTTAGLVVENGVRDATNKDLIFDPDSATAAYQVFKVTDTGAPGDKIVTIMFDEHAAVNEPASEYSAT